MARWKKILIAVAILLVVFVGALYAFLSLYDFNKFKPMIAKAVKDATGRELSIAGNIEFELGIRPTLVAERVSFQNAAWSSTPKLAQIQRLEVQIAVLPIITGKFDFAHLVLVEPRVIVEFDPTGTSNFAFDTGADQTDDSEIPPPPLIFSDVRIEKGLFTYRDGQSGLEFSVRIDRLTADIPGFDKSLQLDFEGAFDELPFALNGTVGPIWAWVEPGYTLPANLTVKAGGATAKINGEIRDPANFKDIAIAIAAEGDSTTAIAKLAGLNDTPEFGAFRLAATLRDPQGQLGLEALDIHVGSEALVAISITGGVQNVLALQGIKLDFEARGQDSANLTRLGLPPPPRKGPFNVTADISDPATKVFSVDNLNIVLGQNEISGQVNLNMAEQVPFLTAALSSQKFELGPSSLDLHLTGPLEKPAIKKLDLKLGTPELAEIRLNGVIADLIELEGVDIDFRANGKDLANFKQLTGQPLPLRGAFSAAGKVLIPVHNNLKIPNLKITVGKNNISGLLNLDFRGDKPQLGAELSLPKLDLPSVLLPQLARAGWAKGLRLVRPVKLAVKLAGFAPEIALKKVDLRAGTLKSAELRLTGSAANLVEQRGLDLKFSLRGNDFNKLKDITAQPFIFAPLPDQGAYALSGHISDQIAKVYEVKDFKLSMADTKLSGRLDINLAGQFPAYQVNMSTPKFNLKPFPIPKDAAYANLTKIDDLGPLKISSKVILEGDRLSMPYLDMRAGREQLAAVEVKGSIRDLTTQRGINLDFNIQGKEVANIAKITGDSLPLQGAFALSGKLTNPAQKNYKIGDLALRLGENNITGSLDLNLSGKKLQIATDLAAPKFTLQPVTLPALETLSRVEDLGPLKLKLNLTDAGNTLALGNLDLSVGREEIILLLLKGKISDLSAVRGMDLAFTIKGRDITKVTGAGGSQMNSKGAFQVSGQFSDPAAKVYRLPAFEAGWGDSQCSGWLELDTSGQRPRLKAELSSDKLDLRPFLKPLQNKDAAEPQTAKGGSATEKKQKAGTPAAKPATRKKRVFPADPLPLAGLQKIDAEVKFRGKQVLLRALAFDNIEVDTRLKDGNLDIKPIKFAIGGGKADGWFNLKSQNKPAELALTLTIDQLAIGPMLDQLDYSRSLEGNLDAVIDLDGTGDAVAALMAGLNGDIRIAVKDGKTESKYLDLLAKYLGSGILRMLNPFEKKRQYTPINCFVNTVKIDNGKADIKLLLDTDQTSIFGAGDVDLKTERLDLGIKPTPKKGAMPGNVSFSLNQLSRPFRLGGTLAKPALVVDPGRTAFVVGKMAGALALGPIGIAAFFADVSIGKKNACELALEKAMKKDQSPDAKKADEKKKEKKSKGFFQRLFGK